MAESLACSYMYVWGLPICFGVCMIQKMPSDNFETVLDPQIIQTLFMHCGTSVFTAVSPTDILWIDRLSQLGVGIIKITQQKINYGAPRGTL